MNKDYKKRTIGLISNSVIKAALLENDLKLPDSSHDYYKFFEEFDDKKPNDLKLNDYYKLRVIVDFISGMTDQYALNHFQKLSGQKIN